MSLKHFYYPILLISIFTFSGCFDNDKDTSPVIARVNGESLTFDQFKRLIPEVYLQSLSESEKQDYVEQWIRQQLLYQLALDENIHREKDIQFRLRQFEQQLLADAVLQRKLKDEIQVTQEEAQSYYESHPDEFIMEAAEIRLSHIVVSTEKLNLADELRKRIASGENFAELAKEFSEDQTAMNGGDLGYFPENEADDELTQKAFKLKVNDVSKPIRTPFGYHLLLVTERSEAGSLRPFDQVKPDIINNLSLDKQKKFTLELLKELEKKAEVETYPELLNQL